MNDVLLDCAVCSDLGCNSTANEDNFFLDGETLPLYESMGRYTSAAALLSGAVLGVFDGMGGEALGEDAADVGVKLLREYSADILDRGAAGVARYVNAANEQVCRIIGLRQKRIGSTFVLLAIAEKKARVYNIGDSRAYLLRDGKLTLLTRDHTIAAQLVGAGILTPAEAESDFRRNQLTQYLGILPEEFKIVAHEGPEFEIQPGDLYLLCTDGVSDVLDEQRLLSCLVGGNEAVGLAENVVDAALKAGSRDNVTALILIARDSGARGGGRPMPYNFPSEQRQGPQCPSGTQIPQADWIAAGALPVGTGYGEAGRKRPRTGRRNAIAVLIILSIIEAFALGVLLSLLIH